MQKGAFGKLLSTIPPMTAPAWTSFATGTNPGKHGLYDWVARKPDDYRFSPVTSLGCQVPTLYSLLSQAGRRVCVLNVPMTYPPERVNGVMISGLPAPSTQVNISYPSSLYDEMLRAIGDYVLYPDPGQAYSDAGVDAFLKRLFKSGNLRARAFDYLRSREKWDFAMVVFNGTDTVSHAMWKHMDQAHPLHDPSRYTKYGSAIRDYYRFVDKYLRKIVQSLDDDTTLIIMSDHGFGPFHKFIHVNNWLIQTGLMHLRSEPLTRAKAALFRLGFSPMGVYDTLMRLGLGALKREVVRGKGQGLLQTLFLSFEDVDWPRTRAYSLGNIGQINLNVVGREPLGCVRPGAEYEQVRDEIMAQLAKLRDPQTGEAVVETIYRREEIYSGDQWEKAPDIVFIPRRLEYFGFGEYEFGSNKIFEAMGRGISGTHRLDGIFMAYGRAVRANLRVEGAQIVDLAPTVLSLMGEPVPDHFDGRVLQEILQDGFQPAHSTDEPARWPVPAGNGGEELTEEDEQVIAERLRGLGYVG
ncbi:MAG: alkaline phosphatase family protein [Chloroflexi bacterium]|nr:alkaline phosphatase family protein [Chloroflexota bacterium]